MKKKMDIENKIIEELLRPLAVNKESLKLTNDGAYLFKKREMVVSTDMMIEGKHFDKSYNPKILASKLLRVNLSDLAAMGANPYGVMLNIAVPKKNSVTWVKDFCKGLKKDLKKFKLKLFGGDLSESSKIFLSATIFGFVTKRFHKQSIASEGSHIYVSGNLGDAAVGLDIHKNYKNNLIDEKKKVFFRKTFFSDSSNQIR